MRDDGSGEVSPLSSLSHSVVLEKLIDFIDDEEKRSWHARTRKHAEEDKRNGIELTTIPPVSFLHYRSLLMQTQFSSSSSRQNRERQCLAVAQTSREERRH